MPFTPNANLPYQPFPEYQGHDAFLDTLGALIVNGTEPAQAGAAVIRQCFTVDKVAVQKRDRASTCFDTYSLLPESDWEQLNAGMSLAEDTWKTAQAVFLGSVENPIRIPATYRWPTPWDCASWAHRRLGVRAPRMLSVESFACIVGLTPTVEVGVRPTEVQDMQPQRNSQNPDAFTDECIAITQWLATRSKDYASVFPYRTFLNPGDALLVRRFPLPVHFDVTTRNAEDSSRRGLFGIIRV